MVMLTIETNISRTAQRVSLERHFSFLTMKTLICSFLSLFFLVSEIINRDRN